MVFELLIKGLIIGFAVAVPVGPIGVLTIKRTLNEGRRSGFITGMGAAFADTLYGVVAECSLTAVSSFLIHEQFWMKLIGGIVMLLIGVKTLLSKPVLRHIKMDNKGLIYNFISTFFLTLTNPATIFAFLAIFAGFRLGSSNINHQGSVVLIVGVLIGASLWWLTLSYIVNKFKSKISHGNLYWINRIAGIVIILFGIFSLYLCINLHH